MTQFSRRPFFQRRGIRFAVVTIAMVVTITGAISGPPGWATDGASVARGGRLYDNLFLETKDRPPSTIHPNYKTARLSMHSTVNSWRALK